MGSPPRPSGPGHPPDGRHRRGHDHGVARNRGGARHAGRLRLALVLTISFLVVETVTALVTGSLALLSDAAEMLTDALGIGMALAAISLANRAAVPSARGQARTFGLYRLEILAALANAVLLFAVAAYVIVEAILRIGEAPDVNVVALFVVGGAGLVVNLVVFAMLRSGARSSLNVEGAYLDALADLLGSVGVIAAAVVVAITGWPYADPIAGAAIGVWIVPRTCSLAARSLRVLLQAAPPHIDVTAIEADLANMDGVVDVHDLHVWTLTSEMEVASVHLVTTVGADPHPVLDEARELLRDRYAIAHATLQVEPADHAGCSEVNW